jgi:hypothetical protein
MSDSTLEQVGSIHREVKAVKQILFITAVGASTVTVTAVLTG